MFWLYLLGAVTVLSIALRRVLRRQKPLDDELYAKNVAVEHVQTGVAWVRADGTIGSLNQSFANTFRVQARDLQGQRWYQIFPLPEHARVSESFRQMLLAGVVSFDAPGARIDGSQVWLNVRLVAVHDHNMRFVGHHCLVDDRTRERDLEEQVRLLTTKAANAEATPKAESGVLELPGAGARRLRKSRELAAS